MPNQIESKRRCLVYPPLHVVLYPFNHVNCKHSQPCVSATMVLSFFHYMHKSYFVFSVLLFSHVVYGSFRFGVSIWLSATRVCCDLFGNSTKYELSSNLHDISLIRWACDCYFERECYLLFLSIHTQKTSANWRNYKSIFIYSFSMCRCTVNAPPNDSLTHELRLVFTSLSNVGLNLLYEGVVNITGIAVDL